MPLYGPDFSTFGPQQVAWLVDDVSDMDLERPVVERERRKTDGLRHYAEDLPIEPILTESFLSTFHHVLPALASVARGLSHRVATQLAAHPGREIVLVSLIRAGVPPATWVQALLQDTFQRRCVHYAVSIIKGFGLDAEAIDYVLARHLPEDIYFFDGWTASGAIRGELDRSLRQLNVGTTLNRFVALSDPCGLADIRGSRKDALLPSACLNSTSCGMISRSVILLSGDLGPRHGAKFYSTRRDDDLTARIHTHVVGQSHFDSPEETGQVSDTPTLAWEIADRVSRLGGAVPHEVKLGLGESMRVLQRRVPSLLVLDPLYVGTPPGQILQAMAELRSVATVTSDVSPFGAAAIAGSSMPHGVS